MVAKTFVALRVDCDAPTAFAQFTDDIDHWWKQGPRNRLIGNRPGVMEFREEDGTRYVQEVDKRRPDFIVRAGKVTKWEPGKRLSFEWRWPMADPKEPVTLVDIRFTPLGDHTRITLEHLGLEKLSGGHPGRNGLNDNRFKPMMTHYWQAHMVSLRNRIKLLSSASSPT
ncbi:SRPBCC domain-containing protein [Thalassospira australica]|uniref:SRPBCC domain-containing protein n=1 Tax=Thalassospira australica TaxID=1528106 RepID=UPI00068EE39F|nr:SRPBCC domain-containing protein [Thalassospira australica]